MISVEIVLRPIRLVKDSSTTMGMNIIAANPIIKKE
jgi:hypothetical protein